MPPTGDQANGKRSNPNHHKKCRKALSITFVLRYFRPVGNSPLRFCHLTHTTEEVQRESGVVFSLLAALRVSKSACPLAGSAIQGVWVESYRTPACLSHVGWPHLLPVLALHVCFVVCFLVKLTSWGLSLAQFQDWNHLRLRPGFLVASEFLAELCSGRHIVRIFARWFWNCFNIPLLLCLVERPTVLTHQLLSDPQKSMETEDMESCLWHTVWDTRSWF